MNQINDSLLELEKVKQEILDKLKEIEKIKESVKKQIETTKQEQVFTEQKKEEPTKQEAAVVSDSQQKAEPTQTAEMPLKDTPPVSIKESIETKPEVETPTPSHTETKSDEKKIEEKKEQKEKTAAVKTAKKKKEEPAKKTTTKAAAKKKSTKPKAAPKKQGAGKKASLNQKRKEIEKRKLENFKISIANRTQGKTPADPGNTGMKHTNCEVFIFIVDDNELQLKVLQEQFKNTRSFKKTKGFTNGKDLLNYVKTRKFPKKSIFLVIMDYFLEDSDDEEAQNGIAVLNDLKAYDPSIDVIMLSSHSDVDIAASASHFGAITFIQKGPEAFRKILNNIVWAINEQKKIRKKADSKRILRIGIIVFILAFVILFTIDYFFRNLGIFPVPTETI